MWSYKVLLLIIITTKISCFVTKTNYEILKSFYRYYSVNVLTIHHCAGDKAVKSLMKNLMTDNFIVVFKNMADGLSYTDPSTTELREGIVVDASCDDVQSVIETAGVLRHFSARKFWLFFSFIDTEKCNQSFSSFGYELFKSSSALSPSQVVWIESCYIFYDVYRIGKKLISTEIGRLQDGTGNEQMILENLAKVRLTRQDFRQTYLRTRVVIQFPNQLSHIGDVHQRGTESFLKRTYPSMKTLVEDLNFRIVFKTITNFGWSKSENGTFLDGLLGMFQRKEIDFAMQSLLMREDRFGVLDYSAELIQTAARIIYRQPPLSSISNIYILPFTNGVWLSSVALLVITTTIIIFELKLHKHHERAAATLHPGDLLTFLSGAICQQGFALSPSTVSIRLTILVLFVSSLFLFTSYSANIVALLQSPSTSIKTLADLVDSPLRVAIQDVPYNVILIKESNHPKTQELYQKKVRPKNEDGFLTVEEGMRRVRQGMFAFQVDVGAAYDIISATYTEGEKCGLAEVELYQLPIQAIALQKGSPYVDLFRIRLRWHRESGLMDRIAKIWVPQKPICESKVGGFVSVGMTEAMPAVKVFCYGAAAAIILLIFELLYFHFGHLF